MMHFLCKNSDRLRLLVAVILLGNVGSASADVQLPNIFSDSMVLQRGQERLFAILAPGAGDEPSFERVIEHGYRHLGTPRTE